MPATAPPTAAPPSFYDSLPTGGETAAGGPAKKDKGSDADEELMKGFTGIYRVLSKMGKLRDDLKPGIDKIKTDIKNIVVAGLKRDPKDLDTGDEGGGPKPAEPAPASGGPAPAPTPADESHTA